MTDLIRSIKLLSESSDQVVTTEEVKKHSVIEHDTDDDYLDSLIIAATKRVQFLTRRQLLTAGYSLKLSNFPYRELELPYGNLQSVTSITYNDLLGVSQTLATNIYDVDVDSDPGVISLGYLKYWPPIRCERTPVQVSYTCGWANVASIPEELKLAIKMLVATWYNKREDTAQVKHIEVPNGVMCLVTPYRLQGWGYP